MLIRIRRGLDVSLPGVPAAGIEPGSRIAHVAVLGADYVGLRPQLEVAVGDRVRLGQPLLVDRHEPGWRVVSPGGGRVAAIERGPRRRLLAVVVALADPEDAVGFESVAANRVPALGAARVTAVLVESGLWMALRTRPFGRPPTPGTRPSSIFVRAMASEPLAGHPERLIGEHGDAFVAGLQALTQLTDGPVFVCARPDVDVPLPAQPRLRLARFAGPHPAGLPGTHIHFLDPIGPGRTVWYIGHRDVIAIGKLLVGGRLWVECVVALGGPMVARPRHLRTRLGASLAELLQGELRPGPGRVLSGSALSGRSAAGPEQHLGRFHEQVTVLAPPPPARRTPGPFLPVEDFARVMPLSRLPLPVLEALLVGDTEAAQALGCLELEEEDLALASYVCPGRLDYGRALRACLTASERER